MTLDKDNLGCCGLNCQQCPVYKATATNDNPLREKTATEWTTRYAAFLPRALEPADMNCEGCHSKNCFVGCSSCPIRSCCNQKGYSTCAECPEFSSCGMLNGFFSFNHQPAKQNLEAIRK